MLAPFRLAYRVSRRFLDERLTLIAAALSLDTLLSLVPIVAVGVWLLHYFPIAKSMTAAVENFVVANLLPEQAGLVVADYLGRFAHRADDIPSLGIAFLVLTALAQTFTIEHTFNSIWKIKTGRPIIIRIAIHLIALVLGPLVFGGSLVLIALIAGASFGVLGDPVWVEDTFVKTLPIVLMAALFTLLYWAVPNCKVSRWHALVGGVLASLGFVALQRLFSFYLANYSTYSVLYGAFSAIPIFIIWLILSWGIIHTDGSRHSFLQGSQSPMGLKL